MHQDSEHFLRHLISEKQTFSVTRVSLISGFSEIDLPVAIAYRPNSKILSQSGGKGLSKTLSLISALMESYECDAAEKIIPEILACKINDLPSGIRSIDPKELPITLPSYTEHCYIDWSIGRGLFSNEKIFVPFDAISLDFTRMSDISRNSLLQLTSNGLASGQTFEGAIISALFEIIERHCITSYQVGSTSSRIAVDFEGLSAYIRDHLISRFTTAGFEIELFDYSLYSSFPVYECTIKDSFSTNVGWGCHIDKDTAIIRAITEANQARTIQKSGSREDMHRYDYISTNNSTKALEKSTMAIHKIGIEVPADRLAYNKTKIQEVLSLWRKHKLPEPIYKVVNEDQFKCAVRVVVPSLHGYNYPAYMSNLRKDFLEDVSDYNETITHLPAAI